MTNRFPKAMRLLAVDAETSNSSWIFQSASFREDEALRMASARFAIAARHSLKIVRRRLRDMMILLEVPGSDGQTEDGATIRPPHERRMESDSSGKMESASCVRPAQCLWSQ